ncbi:hypothetical protein ACSSNL_04415 [Thalassobius sp. S69A]|uniref:hypothetical protein n=1 Tax=unclassified Thalassovita TaxID=2619711 RepID=UPI003C7D7D5A
MIFDWFKKSWIIDAVRVKKPYRINSISTKASWPPHLGSPLNAAQEIQSLDEYRKIRKENPALQELTIVDVDVNYDGPAIIVDGRDHGFLIWAFGNSHNGEPIPSGMFLIPPGYTGHFSAGIVEISKSPTRFASVERGHLQ